MMIEGIQITPLKILKNPSGDVMRGIRSDENQFEGFGEVYFSKILSDKIKGWKYHKEMTMNLIVISGEVKFVVFDDRKNSNTKSQFDEYILSCNKYSRLTIPPKVWIAFKGLSLGESIIMNFSNILHDDQEVVTKEINELSYNWKTL